MSKNVLDACCGSRMFWFDKENPITVYQDKRELDTTLCDGRQLIIKPDVIGDFTKMSWGDEQFKMVVLDPPHLKSIGDKAWMALKYGKLKGDFRDELEKCFHECFRVLENDGVLVFKWNEDQVLVSEILNLSPYKPMIGHKSGKQQKTHWILFMKNESMLKASEANND